MTNIAMEAMTLIEIDGLPNLIAWWIFPWQTVNVITRWYTEVLSGDVRSIFVFSL